MAQKRRLQQGFCQIHARASYPWSPVSSPRPRSFQLSVVNIVSKAQALADVPYVGPVFGVSKTRISGFVAVGPHCIYIYIYYIFIYYFFLGKKSSADCTSFVLLHLWHVYQNDIALVMLSHGFALACTKGVHHDSFSKSSSIKKDLRGLGCELHDTRS